MRAPATLRVARVDDWGGTVHLDVDLPVERVVQLGCGCRRHECRRPDGTAVHVLLGGHCERLAPQVAAAAA